MSDRIRSCMIFVVLVVLSIGFVSSGTAAENNYSKAEKEMLEQWVADHLSTELTPFFSFQYDNQASDAFLKDWQLLFDKAKAGNNISKYILTFKDPKTGLVIHCSADVYADFPAVEWVLEFENTGTSNTPVLENIQAADLQLFNDRNEFVLHHALGSNHGENDFAPLKNELKPHSELVLAPKGGRSSDETALPFFNLQAGDRGVMAAVGWTGQWQSVFSRKDEKGVEFSAGMEKTHLVLYPGECIRTPRILLLFWQGDDRMRGHNLFRQFVLAHHTPQLEGKPYTGPLACNGGAFMFEEFTLATEHNMIALAERYQQFGLQAEYWWIDAGWYGSMDFQKGTWHQNVGNWYIRKEHFPNGLKPVADAVEEMGLKFILWFEPERVYKGTWVDTEHPEWVIKRNPDDSNGIFNLGIREARQWMTDLISTLIEENGVDLYRQDFNIRPLDYWRSLDAPDRQGMTEIRHIEGLYAFWDELLERHPGLVIDNCASGGRRLDLEMISRSVALWRSDYNYTEPTGRQNHTYGLSFYFPQHGTGSTVQDMYVARSTYSASMVTGWNLYENNFPQDKARFIYDEYKKIRPNFEGDFFPLTEYSTRHDRWMAYQFHQKEDGTGMVLVFRRPRCNDIEHSISLQGLEDDSDYELCYENNGAICTKSGRELKNGIEIRILDNPGSQLITYKRMNK